MNCCEKCIEYQIHHKQTDSDICPECGLKTSIWKQGLSGTFYVECSNCGATAAVDLNTPCESDLIFQKSIQIIVEPHNERFDTRVVLDTAKVFQCNGMQMIERLRNGFKIETPQDKYDEAIALLNRYGIRYHVTSYDDPRSKYLYYKHCRYPYSPMRRLL